VATPDELTLFNSGAHALADIGDSAPVVASVRADAQLAQADLDGIVAALPPDLMEHAGSSIVSAVSETLTLFRADSLESLTGNERTVIGSAFENHLRHNLGADSSDADLSLADGEVQLGVKFSLRSRGWMISMKNWREGIPQLLVSPVQGDAVSCRHWGVWCGLLDDSMLSEGSNRDMKRTVSKTGMRRLMLLGQVSV
jgi:hypothetical protein